MRSLLTSFLLCISCKSSFSATWGYKDEHGPEHWADTYSYCKDSSQSPIDFADDVLTAKREMPLKMLNYDQNVDNVTIINNGHTVKLVFSTEHPMYMFGGGLCTAYKLAQLHIHWGSDDNKGSEHTVNGEHYPVEFHFVHYKARHDDLGQALQFPEEDTLAVLGVFGEVSEEENSKLSPLLDNLELVQDTHGEFEQIPSFPASNLLPDSLEKFYRYSGSLTTPTCNEVVAWTVAQTTIPISQSQLDKLRSLKLEDGTPMVDNYRPVQELNGRQVFDIETYSVESGCGENTSSLLLLVAASITLVNKLY